MRLDIPHRSAGFTIIETLISLGMMSVVFLGIQSATTYYFSQIKQQKENVMQGQITQAVFSQVMSDASQMQVNYGALNDSTDATLDPANLPMAWDKDLYLPAEQCVPCPGRLGFKIVPIEGMRGLYQATIRITHKTLLPNGGYKDYKMVLGNL